MPSDASHPPDLVCPRVCFRGGRADSARRTSGILISVNVMMVLKKMLWLGEVTDWSAKTALFLG